MDTKQLDEIMQNVSDDIEMLCAVHEAGNNVTICHDIESSMEENVLKLEESDASSTRIDSPLMPPINEAAVKDSTSLK